MKNLTKLLLYSFLLSFFACGNNDIKTNCEISPEVEKTKIPNYDFASLEDEIISLTSQEKLNSFAKKYPEFTQIYLKQNGRVADTTLLKVIQQMSADPYIDTLYQDVKKHFPKTKQLQAQFGEAFKHIKYYYPNFKAPKVYTMVTGLGSYLGYPQNANLFVSPDIVVVSLEFFIGEQAKYKLRPNQVPQYVWNKNTKDYIVPNTLLFISNIFNKVSEEDKSLVADMVFYGKSLYFVHTMMPCTPKNQIMGYNETEFANITDAKNKRFIWNHFVENKLFYSTTTAHKISYIQEKPYVQEISKDCPGRIGQWLGWRMIEEYAKQKEDVSLKEIMSNPNARKIFTLSRYKGD